MRIPSEHAGIPRPLNYLPPDSYDTLDIRRNGERLTILVPPVGWRTPLLPLTAVAALTLCTPPIFATLAAAGVVPWPMSAILWLGAIFCPLGTYLLLYTCHLATRRVRIEVLGHRLRREILSPLRRWERSWSIRDVVGIVRSDENHEDDAHHLFYMLYVQTRDGRTHVLLDCLDAATLDAVARTVRDALDLGATE